MEKFEITFTERNKCSLAEVKYAADLAARTHGYVLTVSAVDARLALRADRDLLFSAIRNLLQNAFKFTHDHAAVTLNTYAVADQILIDVKLYGGALPPGNTERMLLPFTQSGEDITGLGSALSAARRGVEQTRASSAFVTYLARAASLRLAYPDMR